MKQIDLKINPIDTSRHTFHVAQWIAQRIYDVYWYWHHTPEIKEAMGEEYTERVKAFASQRLVPFLTHWTNTDAHGSDIQSGGVMNYSLEFSVPPVDTIHLIISNGYGLLLLGELVGGDKKHHAFASWVSNDLGTVETIAIPAIRYSNRLRIEIDMEELIEFEKKWDGVIRQILHLEVKE